MRDFDREIGPGKDSDGIGWKFRRQDFAHPHTGAVLDPFGTAH
jgi:hypothetical protein